MSTKLTIEHGPGFHFYEEAFDEDYVYLELSEDAQFICSPARVTLFIPVAVWEKIRHRPSPLLRDFGFLMDMNDDQIREYVTQGADQRIASYKKTGFSGGLFVYGSPDESREEQIENAFNYFRSRQERVKEILNEKTDKS